MVWIFKRGATHDLSEGFAQELNLGTLHPLVLKFFLKKRTTTYEQLLANYYSLHMEV